MTLDKSMIEEIAERVKTAANPEKILVFGSTARGTATPESDIDLLVLESEVANTREESVKIRRALRGLGVAFDVLVMRSNSFEATKDIPGSLASCAHLEGRVIYAA